MHRIVTAGQPLASDCEIGKAIEALADKLCGGHLLDRRPARAVMEPALSQS
jgi:hypothetical protein